MWTVGELDETKGLAERYSNLVLRYAALPLPAGGLGFQCREPFRTALAVNGMARLDHLDCDAWVGLLIHEGRQWDPPETPDRITIRRLVHTSFPEANADRPDEYHVAGPSDLAAAVFKLGVSTQRTRMTGKTSSSARWMPTQEPKHKREPNEPERDTVPGGLDAEMSALLDLSPEDAAELHEGIGLLDDLGLLDDGDDVGLDEVLDDNDGDADSDSDAEVFLTEVSNPLQSFSHTRLWWREEDLAAMLGLRLSDGGSWMSVFQGLTIPGLDLGMILLKFGGRWIETRCKKHSRQRCALWLQVRRPEDVSKARSAAIKWLNMSCDNSLNSYEQHHTEYVELAKLAYEEACF